MMKNRTLEKIEDAIDACEKERDRGYAIFPFVEMSSEIEYVEDTNSEPSGERSFEHLSRKSIVCEICFLVNLNTSVKP